MGRDDGAVCGPHDMTCGTAARTAIYHGLGLGRLSGSPDRTMDLMRLPPLLMLLTIACASEDPILERAAAMEEAGTAPAAASPAAASRAAASPAPPAPPAPPAGVAPAGVGIPEPPAPGQGTPPKAVTPGEPAPGDPGQPAPGTPEQPRPGSPGSDGPSVAVSGTISVEGWSGGSIRIDIFDGDQLAAAGSTKRPSVVAQAKLERPGPFEVRVPMAAGRVWIGAFADENRNGRPDPRDPSGWYGSNPVSVDEDRSGVILQLSAAPPPGGGVEME